MYGIAVFILAIFALAAIMRLVVPLTSAMGRASAGAMLWVPRRRLLSRRLLRVPLWPRRALRLLPPRLRPRVVAARPLLGQLQVPAARALPVLRARLVPRVAQDRPADRARLVGQGRRAALVQSGSSGSSGSGRSGWDAARDLGNAMPGGSRGVGDMIDE